MTRIWFNRNYATTYHVVGMLRENPDRRPVHVTATHVDPDSPVLAAADDAFVEPDELGADDYVAWALEFAHTHRIDLLVPRLYAAELAAHRDEFVAMGTTLMAAPADTIRLFENKVLAYEAAKQLGLTVPPYRVARTGTELRDAYADLTAELSGVVAQICVKPVAGAGGAGYRRLTTGVPELSLFAGEPRARADLDLPCAALDAAAQRAEFASPLLVMPYLTGPEISVDCLADTDGRTLAAIGRGRDDPGRADVGGTERRRVIVDDPVARHTAETLNRAHRVAYLSNTQVRYWQGPGDTSPRAYLLELNTRMAGGLSQTSLAGVNLPWASVRLALGEDIEPLHPTFGAAFTTIAAVVPLPERPPGLAGPAID
jgi:biotin carboxylase